MEVERQLHSTAFVHHRGINDRIPVVWRQLILIIENTANVVEAAAEVIIEDDMGKYHQLQIAHLPRLIMNTLVVDLAHLHSSIHLYTNYTAAMH